LITPLIGLVRYKHGNIGKKGSVTFVRTKSKLAQVVPNLPSEVQYLVFERPAKDNEKGSKTDGNMKSFKARRGWILRSLQLLQCTGIAEWSTIQIDEERINAWPEDGNLLDLVERVKPEASAVGSVADHEDTGPAPLQNQSVEDEQFYSTEAPQAVDLTKQTESARAELEDFLGTHCDGAPKVQIDGANATMQQSEVLPTGGFVNMRKTKYAWALAFPKLFPPRLIDKKHFGILGDFTATPFSGIRDQTVPMHQWANYCMWRSDGACVKHPTFAMALDHEIFHASLQTQGRISLTRNKIPFGLNLDEFKKQTKTDQGMKRIEEAVNYSAGNVRGTDQYLKKLNGQFRATTFFHNYVNDLDMRYFCTGSQAEFADPYLRRLLSKYVAVIDSSKESGQQILDNDGALFKAVVQFKNCVTHFFAYKQECWLNTILHNVLGIESFFNVFEFAKGRGAIHGHGCGFSNTPVDQSIDEHLSAYAIGVHQAVQRMEAFISERYDSSSATQPSPLEIIYPRTKAMKARRDFLSKTEDGKVLLSEFDLTLVALNENASKAVNAIMEFDFGVSAMHIGQAPQQWVKPGGAKGLDYRATQPDMLTKEEAWKLKPLAAFKFSEENHLHSRRVGVTNHCFTHKCSGYCWRQETLDFAYEPDKHGPRENNPNPNVHSIFVDAKG
jgi:hypothetical protein